ncbi:MAG TPA: hypothetical protein VGG33_16800, partial [Polyangia bacterium]
MTVASIFLLSFTLGIAAPDGGVDAGSVDAAAAEASPVAVAAPIVQPAATTVRVTGTVYARGTSDPVLGASIVVDAQAVGE